VAWLGEAGRMRGFTPDGRELSLAGLPLFNSSNEGTGLRSADGRRLYVVSSGKLTVAAAMDGRVERLIDLPPAWRLPAAPLTAASLSPDGRWLALESNISATDLLLIDLEAGTTAASGLGRRRPAGLAHRRIRAGAERWPASGPSIGAKTATGFEPPTLTFPMSSSVECRRTK